VRSIEAEFVQLLELITPDLQLICLGVYLDIGDAFAVVPDCAAWRLHWPWQGKGFLLEFTPHIFSYGWQFYNHNSDLLRNSIRSVIRVLNDPFPQLATSLERSFVLWAFHRTRSYHRHETTGLNSHLFNCNFFKGLLRPIRNSKFQFECPISKLLINCL